MHLELLAVHVALVLAPAGGEADLVAAHFAFQRERLPFGAQRAREHLEFLLQRQLAVRALVSAGDADWAAPEPGRGPAGATVRGRRPLGALPPRQDVAFCPAAPPEIRAAR